MKDVYELAKRPVAIKIVVSADEGIKNVVANPLELTSSGHFLIHYQPARTPHDSGTKHEAAIAALSANGHDVCPVCLEVLEADDLCATDIEMGICHAECLEGSPVVDIDTGEVLPDGELDTYRFGDLNAPAPRPAKLDGTSLWAAIYGVMGSDMPAELTSDVLEGVADILNVSV
ncbi:hypothetical protein [Pararhizobium arenae]|uniref:hypothetical protein n=1 Tax=Pararhizobium arenae TaxID=1856850 RepID=UPI000AACC8E1|nr:hypothetical protein [Pararhizobium arenae]